jgi:hypothetical protein
MFPNFSPATLPGFSSFPSRKRVSGISRYASACTLTFAVPMAKFPRMVENMEESFLITPTWTVIRKRIAADTQ